MSCTAHHAGTQLVSIKASIKLKSISYYNLLLLV